MIRELDSSTALGHISGIGAGVVERYGEAILQPLAGSSEGPSKQLEAAAEAAP